MFISKREFVSVQVYLRAILSYIKTSEFGELAYLVNMIEEDLNLHRAAKKLLYDAIDSSLRAED